MPESDTIPAALKKPSGITMMFLLMVGLTGGGGIGSLVTGAGQGERLASLETEVRSIKDTLNKIERKMEQR